MKRPDFIGRAQRLLADMELDENTRKYWNEAVRKPHEKEIAQWPEYEALKRQLLRVIKCEEDLLK